MTNDTGQNDSILVLKSGLWYTVANFVIKGISFLTIPIFTRLLTKAEFGDFNNFTSWLSLISIVATLSLNASLIRARFDFKDNLNQYVKSIMIIGTLWTIVVLLITQIWNDFFTDLFSMKNSYIIYMFIYIAVSPAFDYFMSIQRFRYKYKFIVLISLFSAVCSVVLSIVLIHLLSNKLDGRLLGAFLPLILIGILFYIYYFIKGGHINTGFWKYALKICLPYVPHLLAMTVLSSTDRVMITKICGSEATAIYSLAYTSSLAVSVIWTSFNNAFSPWLGEKLNAGKYDDIYNVSTKYVLLFAIPVFGIMLIAPELVLLLGGKAYSDSVFVMPPIMLGCFFQFIYSMYVNVEQFEKKTVGMAIASVCAGLLNLGLNFIFIPIYGYVAAAYTTLVGYLFLTVVHFYLVKRMNLTKVYNTKRIIQIAFVIIILGIGVNLIYQYSIIRYSIISLYAITFLIILFKNRDKLHSIIKG